MRTGGIYLSVPYSGATVYQNDSPIGVSGYLNRNFYIGNLAPGSYAFRVERESDEVWRRTLVVEQELVTEADVFLVPEEVDATRLVRTSPATGTDRVLGDEAYDAYLAAFARPIATTTEIGSVDNAGGIALFIEGGDVYERWMRTDAPPSSFCLWSAYCVREIPIERGPAISTSAALFQGGVVYRTKDGTISIAEADIRPTPIIKELYSAPGADFRIIAGQVIVEDDGALYELEL